MEKQFIDLVVHVFTLEWAILALPLSLLLSLLSNRVLPCLVIALFAVMLHHIGVVALPMLFAGGDLAALPTKLAETAGKLEPLSITAEYVAYAFLIVVFSLTRQDMARPSVTN